LNKEFEMAKTQRAEQRLLTDDERTLVEQSHFPALSEVSDEDLKSLVANLRERRDRARDIANRQRREMRGKAAPAGARAAGENAGSKEKVGVLAAAVQRVNREAQRRRSFTAKASLVGNAQRALEMRRASMSRNHPRPGRTAGAGMKAKPNTRRPRIAEPMEVGRVSQFVKAGQARKDAR
jgi:hypothetical protein